jgi:hypothetical protein
VVLCTGKKVAAASNVPQQAPISAQAAWVGTAAVMAQSAAKAGDV